MSIFQPYQIVYLEKGISRLYAEVIQVVPDRELCWARPLVLIEAPAPEEVFAWEHLEQISLEATCPLIDGPDILWPLEQFRPALDMEVLPLLALIQQDKLKDCDRTQTHERLHRFIRQFWQA
ncbi:hypothetical protein [Pseudanabaena sp. FACHB-2040]|uniref:hypothetical protein n=1 Tax=Pseudanabaena sp. FACHB-2040 TaxID=2692859 RepID=UPI00168249A5|nr:hypothetical protein [Pseudanabaena sp. FACHB-2040]MBD2260133.1 hypothetical protein [Pseudanabaena sp. FACHB-2040]